MWVLSRCLTCVLLATCLCLQRPKCLWFQAEPKKAKSLGAFALQTCPWFQIYFVLLSEGLSRAELGWFDIA